MVSDEEWELANKKFDNAMKKWVNDPTKGFANYLLAEYDKDPIRISNEL